VTPLLEGIGFYEMTDNNGVVGASLAGGTEIVIFGQGMSHTPSTIQAIFNNKNLGLGQGQGGAPRPCKYLLAFSQFSYLLTDFGSVLFSSLNFIYNN
jgi:hypothetical protein